MLNKGYLFNMKFIITESQFEKINNTFKGIPYRSIIEYIKINYNPDNVVVKFPDSDKEGLLIIFKFNSIDKSYITNPNAFDLDHNKRKNLEKVIRYDILNFFGVKTSGLRVIGNGNMSLLIAPYEYHDLTILVQ
jgi:hypothetical protein